MQNYLMRFIEIHSLFEKNDRSYVNTTFTIENECVEFDLELDPFTMNNLKKIMPSDNVQTKIRLSFRTAWYPFGHQYRGFIAKVTKDQSEKISFPCSRAFVDSINGLKEMTSLKDLKKMIHTHPVDEMKATESYSTEEKKISTERQTKKKSIFLSRYALYGMVCICLMLSYIFVMKYTEGFFQTKESTSIARIHEGTALAHAKAEQMPDREPPLKEVKTNKTMESSEIAFELPKTKLDEVISYSLSENEVALTFDDGPSEYTKEIVDILLQEKVGGTFFFIGQNVNQHKDAVKYAYEHGYSIGNHSFSHTSFSGLSSTKQQQELEKTNQLIQQITDEQVTLFRPPYGAKDEKTAEFIKNHQMKIVLWDRDTEDWKTRSADETFDYVVNTDSSGAIYLFHELPSTIDALPGIIHYLKEQGLKIVSLN